MLCNYLNTIALHTTREAIKNIILGIETRTSVGVIVERTLDDDLTRGSVYSCTVVP